MYESFAPMASRLEVRSKEYANVLTLAGWLIVPAKGPRYVNRASLRAEEFNFAPTKWPPSKKSSH